jgi:phosphatidylglycerophosphatase A
MSRIHASQLKNPIMMIAFGFGSGLVPKAPGTAGTLLAVPLCIVLQNLSLMMYGIAIIIITVPGIYVCSYTIKKLGKHDHPAIVIDEIAGYLITMFAVPVGWEWLLAGFVLFRFFDVVKPWPISWLDKNVKGGLGVMVDDVLAGLVSLAFLHGYLMFSGYY